MDNFSERLLELRKNKKLSQEEVADKLNVTRQTVSKWETNQSMPDFDKIVPLCELYGITPNELFMGLKEKDVSKNNESTTNLEEERLKVRGKAKGIAIFLLICGIATGMIVYVCIRYKKMKTEEETASDKLRRQISDVAAIIVTIIYLIISFKTMAWHLTWIIWVIFGLFEEILKLIFMLRSSEDEK